MHLGNIERRLEGLNYRLKYCWSKVIYFIYRPNEFEQEIKKKLGGPRKNPRGTWTLPAEHKTQSIVHDR